MIFLVLCNDRAHQLDTMKKWLSKMPTAVANSALWTIETQDGLIRFQFVFKGQGYGVLALESNGTLLASGYDMRNFELLAHSRARL